MGLGLVWHQLRQQPREADSLAGEVRTVEVGAGRRGVALGEDDVEGREHAGHTLGQQRVWRYAVRDAGVRDLRPRPQESLVHRRLGDEECRRGLRRAQATERLHRQRDARRQRKRRVAAGEQEPQAVVGERGLVHVGRVIGTGGDRAARALGERRYRVNALAETARAAQTIERLASRGGRQPRRRHLWDAALPRGQRGEVGVLQRVLREGEIAAEVADERGQNARAVLADGPLQRGGGRHLDQPNVITGRTSTEP